MWKLGTLVSNSSADRAETSFDPFPQKEFECGVVWDWFGRQLTLLTTIQSTLFAHQWHHGNQLTSQLMNCRNLELPQHSSVQLFHISLKATFRNIPFS